MKAYIVVIEGDTYRDQSATVSEIGHIHLETANIELVEKINSIKADPIPYFGYAKKEHLRTKWITNRYCEIKDSFTGYIINVFIHEINIDVPADAYEKAGE